MGARSTDAAQPPEMHAHPGLPGYRYGSNVISGKSLQAVQRNNRPICRNQCPPD